MQERKEFDWKEWKSIDRSPELPDAYQMIVRFCWPCDYLRLGQFGTPLCSAPGSNQISMYIVSDYGECHFARVKGAPGVIDGGVFQPSASGVDRT